MIGPWKMGHDMFDRLDGPILGIHIPLSLRWGDCPADVDGDPCHPRAEGLGGGSDVATCSVPENNLLRTTTCLVLIFLVFSSFLTFLERSSELRITIQALNWIASFFQELHMLKAPRFGANMSGETKSQLAAAETRRPLSLLAARSLWTHVLEWDPPSWMDFRCERWGR